MRTTLIALAVACAAAFPTHAQETPEQLVERYFQSFRAGDFSATAAMMDPAALEELRATMGVLVEASGAEPAGELEALFGVESAEAFRALSAVEVYERMVRSTLGDGGGMADLLASAELTILGHVPEGDDVVHVVYRMRMSYAGVEIDQVQLAPLRRTPDGWRVMLTGSLAGMMQGIAEP